MKKRIICIIAGIMMLLSGVANAATYTLPEKMQNHLAIGSGLKGSFTVTADGELSKTPFLNAFVTLRTTCAACLLGTICTIIFFRKTTEVRLLSQSYTKKTDNITSEVILFRERFSSFPVFPFSLMRCFHNRERIRPFLPHS